MLKLFILIFPLLSVSKTIVIDPGHGGNEVGAISTYFDKNQKLEIYEKDLTLELSLKIQKILKEKHDVFLTRNKDVFLSLEERAKVAFQKKADVFISIHFNSSPHKLVQGVETYYLDNHNDKAVHKVERLENRVITTKNKSVDKILIDLAIQLTTKESQALAKQVHQQLGSKFNEKHDMKDRGVKAGLFHVLALAQVPGILLEAGFISNKKELNKIINPDYLENYAQSVSAGIENYLKARAF